MSLLNGHYSLCAQCGRPPLTPIPCPLCGQACCRWACYSGHLSSHRNSDAPSQGDDEESARAGAAVACRGRVPGATVTAVCAPQGPTDHSRLSAPHTAV